MYELMANPHFDWPRVPHLKIWRDYVDSTKQHSVKLESYGPKDLLPILTEALNNNTVMCGSQQYQHFSKEKHKNRIPPFRTFVWNEVVVFWCFPLFVVLRSI
jgi:hypothetical protein